MSMLQCKNIEMPNPFPIIVLSVVILLDIIIGNAKKADMLECQYNLHIITGDYIIIG